MLKLSIIMAAFNAEIYVTQALQSVLNQPFTDFEIIVVDDGSTDLTAGAVAQILDPRVEYFYQENKKSAAARNNGFERSRGEYILFLDADDIYLPGKLGLQAQFLDENPDIGCVASGYQYIDENGKYLREAKPWLSQKEIDIYSVIMGGFTVLHGVTLRREWFERIGRFDPHISLSEDSDLWFRLCLAGCPIRWLKETVCQYRIHSTNISRQIASHYDFHFKALDKAFQNENMPGEIRLMKNQIYMMGYLALAGKHYSVGNLQGALHAFEQAIDLKPDEFLPQLSPTVLSVLPGWETGIFVRNPDDFWSLVFNNLPTRLGGPRKPVQDIRYWVLKSRFYAANREKDWTVVKKYWWKIVLSHPSWLFNRGSLSIMLKAYGLRRDI